MILLHQQSGIFRSRETRVQVNGSMRWELFEDDRAEAQPIC